MRKAPLCNNWPKKLIIKFSCFHVNKINNHILRCCFEIMVALYLYQCLMCSLEPTSYHGETNSFWSHHYHYFLYLFFDVFRCHINGNNQKYYHRSICSFYPEPKSSYKSWSKQFITQQLVHKYLCLWLNPRHLRRPVTYWKFDEISTRATLRLAAVHFLTKSLKFPRSICV